MGRTSIGSSVLGNEPHSVVAERQFFHRLQFDDISSFLWRHILKPLVNVLVVLATITTSARRHDVPWNGLAATRDCNDVIPGVRRARAIGTFASEGVKQKLLCLWRNCVDITPPLGSALLDQKAMCRVGSITLACRNPLVCAALAVSYFVQQKPRLAVRAPRMSGRALLTPNPQAWTEGSAYAATVCACGTSAIATTSIDRKARTVKPSTAHIAPFLAEQNVRRVVSDRDSKALRGRLDGTVLIPHIMRIA